jgi:hypothetical protein
MALVPEVVQPAAGGKTRCMSGAHANTIHVLYRQLYMSCPTTKPLCKHVMQHAVDQGTCKPDHVAQLGGCSAGMHVVLARHASSTDWLWLGVRAPQELADTGAAVHAGGVGSCDMCRIMLGSCVRGQCRTGWVGGDHPHLTCWTGGPAPQQRSSCMHACRDTNGASVVHMASSPGHTQRAACSEQS